MDTVDTVTIKAELINELSAGVAAVKGELKGLEASVKNLDAAGATAASRGLSQVGKSMDDLEKMGKSLGSGIDSLIDKIGNGLASAAKKGGDALALVAVGAAAWGVKTTMSLQQADLAINTFLGSAQAGLPVFNQLKSLMGPFSIGDLTEGFQHLATAGASPQTDIAMLKAIANISAVQVNPGGTFQALSQAINRIQETGLIESRSLLAFDQNNVSAYGLLSQEMGVPVDVVKKALAAGGNIAAPPQFLSDFANLQGPLAKFQGGLQAERTTTLGGQFGQLKAAAGQALSVATTPLSDWLSEETPKITSWMDDVKSRFGTFGPALGAAWKSGNTAMVGDTLSEILFGNGSQAGNLASVASGIKGFGDIVKNDIIPLGKDLLGIAIPALRGLGDVISFLGDHKGIVEGLLITFGGFIGIAKTAMVLTDIAKGFEALKIAIGSGDFLTAASIFLKGMGIGGGPASALTGAAGGAGGAEAGAAGAAGAGGLTGLLGLAATAGGGYMAWKGLKGKGTGSDLQTIGGTTIAGAGIGTMIAPGVGTAIGAAAGAALGAGLDIGKHLFGGSGGGGNQTQVTVHPGAIVVNGAGDPNAVAQAIPQALQDQIDAYNKTAAERQQTTP